MAKIRFIPNDPLAGSAAPKPRTKAKRKKRKATRADFRLGTAPAEDVFQPGTPEFLYWQSREAGLAALEAWELFAGPHKRWQGDRLVLDLLPDAGDDLNAYYDRASFSFFHRAIGDKVYFSGNSTDVVAHEVGHGLLDSMRPDLWDASFLEAGAFHEAFGDCIAVLTALTDAQTRTRLLKAGGLQTRNFVESTAEELSEGIRRIQASHNAATPRHAFNDFVFQLPSTLPYDGPPGALINEVHSFGMLFSGALWDVVSNIFGASKGTSNALLAAAKTTGALLVEAAKTAPVKARFFQSVGRAMVLADAQRNAGANREHIKAAFERHGILLGASAMLAPSMALAGAAPNRATPLQDETKRDLMRRLGATRGDRLTATPARLFGTSVTQAMLRREIELGAVDRKLRGVVAVTEVATFVGNSGKRAAVVGSLPEPTTTTDEVHAFAASLLHHGQIDFQHSASGASSRRRAAYRPASGPRTTHVIKNVGAKRVLTRVGFH